MNYLMMRGGVVATTEPLTNRSTWWIHLALVVACSGLQHWMYSELENVKRKTGFCWTLCIVFHHCTWTLAPRETTGDFIVWAPRFKKGRWRIAEPFQGRTGRLLWGWSVLKVVGTSCNLADSIHQLERMQHSAYLFIYVLCLLSRGQNPRKDSFKDALWVPCRFGTTGQSAGQCFMEILEARGTTCKDFRLDAPWAKSNGWRWLVNQDLV